MDRYQYLGISLIGFSIPTAAYSYLVLTSIPLTAFGLSTLILGIALLQIPSSPIPAQHIRAMLSAAYLNIEALLEEYDVNGKGIYFPQDERINIFIPKQETPEITSFNPGSIKNRVLTSIDNVEGLLIFPPGSELVRLADLSEEINLEDALYTVLVDLIESVDGVKSIEEYDKILIQLTKPKEEPRLDRVENSLGALSISIAGCTIAKILDKPVRYQRTEKEGTKTTAFFKILME
jgi:hypothetical protein